MALKFAELGNKNVKLRIIPDVEHSFVPSSFDKCATDEQRIRVSQDMLNAPQKWAIGVLYSGS